MMTSKSLLCSCLVSLHTCQGHLCDFVVFIRITFCDDCFHEFADSIAITPLLIAEKFAIVHGMHSIVLFNLLWEFVDWVMIAFCWLQETLWPLIGAARVLCNYFMQLAMGLLCLHFVRLHVPLWLLLIHFGTLPGRLLIMQEKFCDRFCKSWEWSVASLFSRSHQT